MPRCSFEEHGGSGHALDGVATNARLATCVSDILSKLSALLNNGDCACGPRFDELLTAARQLNGQPREDDFDTLVTVGDEVVALQLRALSIIEEALLQSSMTSSLQGSLATFNGGAFLDDWLCPALVLADAAEPVLGTAGWPSLRALAVRCLALHASAEPTITTSHWPFFVTVLSRYVPVVGTLPLGSEAAASAEVIVETCVFFLSDVLLLLQSAAVTESCLDGGHCATQLFEALAQILNPSTVVVAACGGEDIGGGDVAAPTAEQQRRLPGGIRRRLSERLCTTLLYGGAWAGQDELSEDPVSVLGLHDQPQLCWLLTWLLLEAFCQPPPPATPPARGTTGAEQWLDEASEKAAYRGKLMCFFELLLRASPVHAELAVVACEVFLSTGIWHLCTLAPLGTGLRTWRLIQMPRLVRLVSRLLGVAAGATLAKGAAARLWLEAVWRPLALLCLGQEHQADACLPKALLAALAAVGVSSEAHAPQPLFAAAECGNPWPQLAAEIASTIELIVGCWKRQGFGSIQDTRQQGRGGTGGVARRDSHSGCRRRSSISRQGRGRAGTPGRRPCAAHTRALPLLERLAVRLRDMGPDDEISSSSSGVWRSIAEERRERLRSRFATANIDVCSIFASASAALLARRSLALPARRGPATRSRWAGRSFIRRRPSLSNGGSRHSLEVKTSIASAAGCHGLVEADAPHQVKGRRVASAATPCKRRRSKVSDDDSDGPFQATAP